MATQKLFPLRAALHAENGEERYRFEVRSITPAKLTEQDAKLFHPPAEYVELQPRPF